MIKDFLAIVGIMCIAAITAVIIGVAWESFKDFVAKKRWKYQVKHRFDKPPTAKCYCKDCQRHENDTGECHKFSGWRTADSWFCWDATPHEKAPKETEESV